MVEVLVAGTLLIVGLFAALALFDRGASATGASIKRDGANAIAEELVERATAARYDAIYNDLVDRRPSTGTPAGVLPGTPAERFRTSLDPDGTLASAPISETDGVRPWLSTASWNVRRGNTTYRVSYHACTRSDMIDRVEIAGPFDCLRPATDPSGNETGGGTGNCRIGFIDPNDIYGTTQPLDVRLQLLGAVGLDLCLSSVSALKPIVSSLCDLLNNSANGTLGNLLGGLTGPSGLLANLQNALGIGLIGANVQLCPSAVESDTSTAQGGIGTSTHVAVEVDWTEKGQDREIRQTTVVRRNANPLGA